MSGPEEDEYRVNEPSTGTGDLRVILATQEYDSLVAFYRDVVGLEVYRSWDRPDGKGTLLRAGGGTIEILDAPPDSPYAPYGGVGIGIEVEDVAGWYSRVSSGSPDAIQQEPYVEHGFQLFRFRDPRGTVIMPFKPPVF